MNNTHKLYNVEFWRGTYIGEGEFLTVIHRGDGNLALRHIIVIVNVVGQDALLCEEERLVVKDCLWCVRIRR